jgi:hypothetical protein
MALSNAERQRRWRQKQRWLVKDIEQDHQLLCRAAAPIIRELKEQAGKGTAGHLADCLQRLMERWPQVLWATKLRLAKAKDAALAVRWMPPKAKD